MPEKALSVTVYQIKCAFDSELYRSHIVFRRVTYSLQRAYFSEGYGR